MSGIAVIDVEGAELTDGCLAPNCAARGAVRSGGRGPADSSLWVLAEKLAVGAELQWSETHGDEAVFVSSGTVEVDGQQADAGGVAIIEADVPAVLRSIGDAELVHFGPTVAGARTDGVLGPPEPTGHRVHVIGPEGAYQRVPPIDLPLTTRVFADSNCKTCRINFFRVSGDAAFISGSHVHTQDEIIHLLAGELRVGRKLLTPGMSVMIPGGTRYGFRTPGAYSFLNYRPDMSMLTIEPGSEPRLESMRPEGVDDF
jgi:hypothetical protein